jgi:hypothetical protein
MLCHTAGGDRIVDQRLSPHIQQRAARVGVDDIRLNQPCGLDPSRLRPLLTTPTLTE